MLNQPFVELHAHGHCKTQLRSNGRTSAHSFKFNGVSDKDVEVLLFFTLSHVNMNI